jgi:hypothetical protein
MSDVSDKSSGRERRASVRYSCSEDSFSSTNPCRPITSPQKENWSAAVRDLSTGGIGLVVNRRFEMGTLLTVDLHDATQTSTRSLLVRVVRVNQETNNHWVLGCAFTSKMSESELLGLM